MTTETMTPYRPQANSGHERFWHLLHAEFTKFRTVRGWVITMIIAILATSAFVFLSSRARCSAAGPPVRRRRPGLAVAVSRSRTRSTSRTSR